MAAETHTNTLKLTDWFDGEPSVNFVSSVSDSGKLTSWLDGEPYANIYPITATTNFMLFMPF